jgi:integrase/recombinase XerD
VGEARFRPAAGEPRREAEVVMVAAVAALGVRRAAELAGLDHQRVLQQPLRVQVGEQSGDGFVHGQGVFRVIFLQNAVLIPAAVADLDEPHPGFEQATGHQALPAEVVGRYVEASGVGKRGSCHLFRHAMATLMHDNGADIRFIQAMLGHAKLTTTEIYTQVSIKKLKEIHTATHPARAKRDGEGEKKKRR